MKSNTTRTKQSVSRKRASEGQDGQIGWTFLSNHSHVMICLARDPGVRLRDVAALVGITERAAIRIVVDLEKGGYVIKERIGRRNRYGIVATKNLRHPLEAHHQVRAILMMAKQ